LKENRGYSGLKGAHVGRSLTRRMQGCVSARRTDDLQQMPAKLRTRFHCLWIRVSPRQLKDANASHLKETRMQILSPRHVKTEESLRLGVESGWYSTKVSGTFVTGPHTTQEDCLSKILELNPPAAKKKF
jgi:hypothetical protein